MTIAHFRRCRVCRARANEPVARRATLAEQLTCCCILLPLAGWVHRTA